MRPGSQGLLNSWQRGGPEKAAPRGGNGRACLSLRISGIVRQIRHPDAGKFRHARGLLTWPREGQSPNDRRRTHSGPTVDRPALAEHQASQLPVTSHHVNHPPGGKFLFLNHLIRAMSSTSPARIPRSRPFGCGALVKEPGSQGKPRLFRTGERGGQGYPWPQLKRVSICV